MVIKIALCPRDSILCSYRPEMLIDSLCWKPSQANISSYN